MSSKRSKYAIAFVWLTPEGIVGRSKVIQPQTHRCFYGNKSIQQRLEWMFFTVVSGRFWAQLPLQPLRFTNLLETNWVILLRGLHGSNRESCESKGKQEVTLKWDEFTIANLMVWHTVDVIPQKYIQTFRSKAVVPPTDSLFHSRRSNGVRRHFGCIIFRHIFVPL